LTREQIKELHYITPIANIPSILQHGILCHRLAKKTTHHSVAMQEVQQIRARKQVPQGNNLHDYANLYFRARNPMMYARADKHLSLCVLRIDPDVLYLPGVIITDGNAASNYTAFYPSPSGLDYLDGTLIFARYWNRGDYAERLHRKRVICAEVLVPDKVEVQYIRGGCVSCSTAQSDLIAIGFNEPVKIDADLFFR
jgi:hypothetical protein